MNDEIVNKLAMILALQAEIEGMKAENKQREILDQSIAYDENQFFDIAVRLREIGGYVSK